MKRSSLVLLPVLVASLAACHRGDARDRSAQAAPTPSPAVASAAPLATAPGDATEATRPPEAAPTAAPEPGRPATPIERARRGASAPRSAQATPVEPPASEPVPQAAAEADRATAAPEPPQAAARPEPIVLPAGTALPVRLEETLASDKSRPEEKVSAALTEDVSASGRVVLPAGSEVIGHVVVAQQSGRVKGRARLVVAFDEIRTPGRTYAIEAPRWDITAASSRSRDAKIAGGAAAAGAIIGAITGGGKGALKGGAIGGAAGGAAVLITRGYEVELPAGSRHKITLRQPLRIQ